MHDGALLCLQASRSLRLHSWQNREAKATKSEELHLDLVTYLIKSHLKIYIDDIYFII